MRNQCASLASAALLVSLLTGCMSATGVGLTPEQLDGDVQITDAETVVVAFEEDAAKSASLADPTDIEVSSDGAPELALASEPAGVAKPALDAVNELSAKAETSNAAPKPTGQKRLARLFSFTKPRPKIDIDRTTTAGLGATSRAPRPASTTSGGNALPGVRVDSLFGVSNGKPNLQADTVRVASAAGLARLAPHGLQAQSDKVEMACFKPRLLGLLDQVRRHYGRDVIVTSGYRSPKQNRRAGGARASRHTTCEAADIQVPGVSKWDLAKYLRTIEGRGGVGTYCHTKSVHIDVGSERDWNWRCRRR